MGKRIKLLYIFHVADIGGGSNCLYKMVMSIDKSKYEPMVIFQSPGPVSQAIEKEGIMVKYDSSITTVPYNRSHFTFRSVLQLMKVNKASKRLKYLISELAPDIVHINTMMMHPFAAVAKRLGKKVVVHVREHWPRGEHVKEFNWALHNLITYADHIIAINKASADMIGQPQKTTVVYDWFDRQMDELNHQKTSFPDFNDKKWFLFLGGVQRIKGAFEVVEVFHKTVKGDDNRLLITGVDSDKIIYYGLKGKVKKVLSLINYDSYSDKVKKIAQKDDRIHLVPATSRVFELIKKAHCLIAYPTIPHAILPIAEAASVGVPVISAETPESIEYSHFGDAGILFPINNKTAFMKALQKLDDDYVNIKTRCIRVSGYIAKKFDSNNNINKLSKIYESLSR